MCDHQIRLELLGGFRVTLNGRRTIKVPANQPGAVLALLALRPADTLTRERIISLLWPDDDPEDSRQRLRQALYILRRDMADWAPGCENLVSATRDAIALDLTSVTIDACQFESEIRASETGSDPREQTAHLQRAVDLFRGELLPGFYNECFAADQRRFSDMFRTAVHALPLRYESAGENARALRSARVALSLDPTSEETHCCLMRLFAASGQPTAVLRQYRELEQILLAELGEPPSPATLQLMQSLRDTGRTILATEPSPATRPRPAMTALEGVDRSASRRSRRALHPRAAIGGAMLILCAFWLARPGLPNRSVKPAPLTAAAATPMIPLDLPEPKISWIKTIPLEAGDSTSEPTGLAIDAEDNIYVTGFVDTEDSDVDYLTQKLSANGELGWQRRYNGAGNDVDRARGIVIDGSGSIIVTGESDNGKGSEATRLSGLDIVTVKYDRHGTRKYAVRWNGIANGEDRPCKVVLDRKGNAFVAGSSWTRNAGGGTGGFEIVCLKLEREPGDSARPSVVKTFLGKGHLGAQATDLLSDGGDDVYVTGSADAGGKTGPQDATVTLRIDGITGRVVWASGAGGRGTGHRHGRFLIGNVLVASPALVSSPNGMSLDIITTQLSPGGAELWSNRFTAKGLSDDWPCAVGPGPDGGFTVAGQFISPGGLEHLSLVAYDKFGRERWFRRLLGVDFGSDLPVSVKGWRDNLYIAGSSSTKVRKGEAKPNLLVLKLRRYDGTPVWMSRLTPEPTGIAEGKAMAIGRDGSVVAAGQADVAGKRVIFVVKYAP